MITESWKEIGPAYGRDYASAKAVKQDFLAGKDFEMLSMFTGGRYCSVRDFAPGTTVLVRYKQHSSVVAIKVPAQASAVTA